MLHHKNPKSFDLGFFAWAVQDENRAAARSAVSNQPSGLLLSPRFPIFRNVYQESTACRSTVCRTSVGRYRTRTAAEPTTACGGNREARLGPRSDFSRPRQGAAEKSANATRQGRAPQLQLLQECLPRKLCLPEHRLQSLGSCSTGQEQCTSEPFVKNKGRVSSWRWYPAFCAIWRILGRSLRTQEKGQALTYRGVLSLAGVIYSAQQIGIYI